MVAQELGIQIPPAGGKRGPLGNIAAELTKIIGTLSDREPESFEIYRNKPWAHGSLQHRDRIEQIAIFSAERWPGDLIEIGAYYGATTLRLLKIARRFKRRVIVIDPWEIGTQNCKGGEYEAFIENTRAWADILDIVRKPSQDEEAIRYVMERYLCFAFIDGRHTYEAAYSDALMVGHCAGIIAMDDILWNSAVSRAFEESSERLERQMVRHNLCREGYLLPC